MCVSLHHVHQACEDFFRQNAAISAPNKDVRSKLVMRLFEVQTQQIFQEGEKKLFFRILALVCKEISVK